MASMYIKLIWDAVCDNDILPCEREIGNPHDPSSVAVRKGTIVVGHVPRQLYVLYSSIEEVQYCAG